MTTAAFSPQPVSFAPPAPRPPTLEREAPFYIVLNAASGSGDAGSARDIISQVLTAGSQPHEFLVAEQPRALPDLVRRASDLSVRHSGAVVVAGGDGTINAAVQAALPAGRPFGIIPQGTFNYTTRTHGIPSDTAAATQALLTAQLKPVQVGMVNDRVFVVNASVGLYSRLLEERETHKRRLGRYRAVAFASGMLALMREHRQLDLVIEHDEQRELVQTCALFVGNNALQLERAGLPEVEDVLHRQLAAVIVKSVPRHSLLWLAARGALGQLGGAQNVRDFSFRRMSVRPVGRGANRPIKVAMDGEVRWLEPPLTFSVAKQPLFLMTPKEAHDAP